MISLSLSHDPHDLSALRKRVPQLVALIQYPNKRVQFQSCWAIANLALVGNEFCVGLHEAGVTRVLLDAYDNMDGLVRMEGLAALVNLTACPHLHHSLSTRFHLIPFLLTILRDGRSVRTGQFAVMALGNLAATITQRRAIRDAGMSWIGRGAMLT